MCYQQCLHNTENFSYACSNDYNVVMEEEAYCKAGCLDAEFSNTAFDFPHGQCHAMPGDCTIVECHIEKCKKFNRYDKCSIGFPNGAWKVVPNDEYCLSFIANPPFFDLNVFMECGDRDCEHDDCLKFKCAADNKNANGFPICGSNDMVYPTAELFCEDSVANGMILPITCNSADCDKQCCYENCIADNVVYQGRCSMYEFTFFEEKEEYCLAACESKKVFEPLLCNAGTSYCDEEQCCLKNCQSNPGKVQCNANDFTLYTPLQSCQDECSGQQGKNHLPCLGGDCTQKDCDLMKCIVMTIGLAKSPMVCSPVNGLFYFILQYCSDT